MHTKSGWRAQCHPAQFAQPQATAVVLGDANTLADPFLDPCDRPASVHCFGHGARQLPVEGPERSGKEPQVT